MCDVTHSCESIPLAANAFRIRMSCDVTHFDVCHDSFIRYGVWSRMNESWSRMIRDRMNESWHTWYGVLTRDITHLPCSWCIVQTCDITRSYVSWLIHVRHHAFICVMTHSCVSWFIHTCMGITESWLACVMTHSYVTHSCVSWLIHSYMYEWVMTHTIHDSAIPAREFLSEWHNAS